MSKNIAIDGPAGAGKSTIAKQLAKDLGYIYVDTGAMYRAMGLYFTSMQIDPQDGDKISEAAKDAVVSLSYVDGMQHVLLNGKDVTGEIRTEEAGKMASATSGYPAVREHLTNLQKELAAKENVVMDGRDIGTCVLPNADLKVYLTASSAVR
jgi:cytidylate kinase